MTPTPRATIFAAVFDIAALVARKFPVPLPKVPTGDGGNEGRAPDLTTVRQGKPAGHAGQPVGASGKRANVATFPT